MTTGLHQAAVSPAKTIISLYALICFLIYGVGNLIVYHFDGSGAGEFLKIVSGLNMIALFPGVFFALWWGGDRYRPTELALIGFLINLFLLPALMAGLTILGVSVTDDIFVSAIGLLTAGGAFGWISSTRNEPSFEFVRSNVLSFIAFLFALVAVTLIFPRNILMPIDQYGSDRSILEISNQLKAYITDRSIDPETVESGGGSGGGLAKQSSFTYINTRPDAQNFGVRFITNCYSPQLSLQGPQTAEAQILKINEVQISSSIYLPISKFGIEFINGEFPERNRIYVSDVFVLQSGVNTVEVECLTDNRNANAYDLSLMNAEALGTALNEIYFVRDEAETSDAQEAYLEGKYALEEISWVNPPLLYPVYHGLLLLIDEAFSSITLFELFAFAFSALIILNIMAYPGQFGRADGAIAAFLVLINFIISIVLLPILHSSAGMFLSVMLMGSWFLWKKNYAVAFFAFLFISLIRYEGLIITSFVMFAFAAVGDHRISMHARKYILASLIVIGGVFYTAFWFWGAFLFPNSEFIERISTVGPFAVTLDRFTDYLQWGLILSCGIPLFFVFAKSTDRMTIYYILIALLCFGFLCSLKYLRPYHFGPFVVAASVAGARAIIAIDEVMKRRLAMIAFLLMAGGACYIVLNYLPRQLQQPLLERFDVIPGHIRRH